MENLDFLLFESLKKEVQNEFLKNHTPSEEEISRWKGIDIIYFQEDLRKKTKGNISEKSFYTYFKNKSEKLPRIDTLNLLCNYINYVSWHEFKKENSSQIKIIENKPLDKKVVIIEEPRKNNVYKEEKTKHSHKRTIIIISLLLSLFVILGSIFLFSDYLFKKKYAFKFIDSDRNTGINDYLNIKIIKTGESPILQKVKPNDVLTYTTDSKSIQMVIYSRYYKTDTIFRNLENSPKYPDYETIELKPNDYAIMLNYYSKKSDVNVYKKREQLDKLISDQALIYQVFDNDTYGVEIIDKNKYITMMTTPTTSLKNLDVIDTQMKNGKITMIKFRIKKENP